MRIIAGSARGRALKAPAGDSVRPTTDRVKEALFNILQFRLAGARVLDLFAGSGNLGLEALSRGAAKAVFVERDMKTLALLRENVQHLGLGERSEVMAGDFAAALPRLSIEALILFWPIRPMQAGSIPGSWMAHNPFLRRKASSFWNTTGPTGRRKYPGGLSVWTSESMAGFTSHSIKGRCSYENGNLSGQF